MKLEGGAQKIGQADACPNAFEAVCSQSDDFQFVG